MTITDPEHETAATAPHAAHRAVPHAGGQTPPLAATRALPPGASETSRRTTGIVFLFAGIGGRHPRMGRGLAARHRVFATALDEVTTAVAQAGGPVIWTESEGFAFTEERASDLEFVAAANFAFGVAAAQLLAAWGVHPDALIGHGIGELCAAVVGGALSLAEAARIVVWRRGITRTAERPASAGINPAAPHTPIYSTTRRGAIITTAIMDDGYWWENAVGAAELIPALQQAAAHHDTLVVEIGPAPNLQCMISDFAEFATSTHPVTRPDDEVAGFRDCLAGLSKSGATPHRPTRQPHQRQSPRDPTDRLAGFRIGGRDCLPLGYWLAHLHYLPPGQALALSDIDIAEPIDLAQAATLRFRHESGSPLVQARGAGGNACAQARLASGPTPSQIVSWMRQIDANRATRPSQQTLPSTQFYRRLHSHDVVLATQHQHLQTLTTDGTRCLADVPHRDPADPAILETGLYLLACLDSEPLNGWSGQTGPCIDYAWISGEPERRVCEIHAFSHPNRIMEPVGEVVGTDQHGAPVFALVGIRFGVSGGAGEAMALYRESWGSDRLPPSSTLANARRILVVGDASAARSIEQRLAWDFASDYVPSPPALACRATLELLSQRTDTAQTDIFLFWPATAETDANWCALAVELTSLSDLLESLDHCPAANSCLVILPGVPYRDPVTAAVAGLVRARDETTRIPLTVLWSETETLDPAILHRFIAAPPQKIEPGNSELRVTSKGELEARHLVPAPLRDHGTGELDPGGTYLVTEGFSPFGAAAVRWLLDSGARDVVVTIRRAMPLPAVLEGREDRIVVVHCDLADHVDLHCALEDLRAAGCLVRGVVHAAPTTLPNESDISEKLLAATVCAARNSVRLTTCDPVDFTVVCWRTDEGASEFPRLAAAHAALHAMQETTARRRVVTVGIPTPHRVPTLLSYALTSTEGYLASFRDPLPEDMT